MPRAPPSRRTTTRSPVTCCPPRALRDLDAGERARAAPAAITKLSLASARATRRAAFALATLDDPLDARIFLVVVGELVEQLIGERLGYHAIDHLISSFGRRPGFPAAAPFERL